MSRRRGAKPSSGIQLFPFLAVLICTMGALVVLLHAFAQRGRSAALKEAETAAIAQAEIDKNELEDTQWRIAQLAESRDKTAAQLNDERLKLSHVEDHERRLAEKLNQLKIAAEEMDRQSAQTSVQGQRYQAELDAAKEKLEQARRDVAGLKQQGKFRSVNYSVVPYDGPNSTNRRPIYIECRDSLIILQPEGIELVPQDFIGFFGPGNPLASALRAKREYYARQSPTGTLPLEPYPLLLVRPEGIQAYYAARAALDSWGSDFGYELIGADWKLAFPDSDPQLAALTRQVVGEARLRHREYILTSPQVAKSRPKRQYHARAQGGFAPTGGGGGAGGSGKGTWEDFAGEWARANGGGAGGPDGRGGLEDRGRGYGGTGPGGSGYGSGASAAGEMPDGNDVAGSDRSGSGFGPGGTYPNGSRRTGSELNGKSGNGTGGTGTGDSLTDANSGQAGRGAGPGGNQPGSDGSATSEAGLGESTRGEPNSGQTANGSRFTASGSQGKAGGAPTSSKSSGPSSGYQGNASGSGASGGASDGDVANDSGQAGNASGPPSINAGSQASPHMPKGSGKKRMQSMAGQRGKDWGLPEGASRATPAIRPVLVECHADRLIVVSNDRLHPSKEIKLSEKTQDSMDDLISAVWEHTKSWGTAGKGMIWRPTLTMEVRPGAADRYADIKALLADSGLDVHERVPPPATVKQPTKKSPRR